MNNLAKKIIFQTKSNYNTLAKHFSYSRGTIWPELKEFAQQVKPNSKVLDLGCGNGRLSEALKHKNIDYFGLDFSEKLIEVAQKRYPQAKFKTADITRKQTWQDLKNFDHVFCIAVLHHFPTKNLQQKLVSHIEKTLKTNGRLYLTVWNLWQMKYLKHHFSLQSIKLKCQLKNPKVLYFPYKLSQGRGESKVSLHGLKPVASLLFSRRNPAPKAQRNHSSPDLKSGGLSGAGAINRFIYAFTLKELKKLFEKEFIIENAWSSPQNLCLVAKKKV